jgi:hypothetical protein
LPTHSTVIDPPGTYAVVLWVTGLATGDPEADVDADGLPVGVPAVDEPVEADVTGGWLGLVDLSGLGVGLGDRVGDTEGVTDGLAGGPVGLGLVEGLFCGAPVLGEVVGFEVLAAGAVFELDAADGEVTGVGLWLSLPMTCCSVITWGWLPLISWPTRPTAVRVTPVTSAHDSTQPMIRVSVPASDLRRADALSGCLR